MTTINQGIALCYNFNPDVRTVRNMIEHVIQRLEAERDYYAEATCDVDDQYLADMYEYMDELTDAINAFWARHAELTKKGEIEQ